MKIVFRKIVEADLETIRKWRMLPEVTRYMYTDPKLSQEEQRRWYKKTSADTTCKYWIVRVDDSDIGLACLTDIDMINSHADWAYYIAESNMREKGLGKQLELNILFYVFEMLKLNKLCCEAFAWNEKVISIHEQLGSKIEGKRREHIKKDGKFNDIVEMAILKREWESIKGKYKRIPAVFEE